MKTIHRIALASFLVLFSSASALAFGGGNSAMPAPPAAPALPGDQILSLQIPVFSPLFAETPVAVVEGRPILLGDITPELQAIHDEMPLHISGAALTRKFNEVLDRLVAERSGGAEPEVEIYAERAISKDRILTLKVPVFSPHFLFTPVAAVDEEPIPMGEFTRELGSMHAEMAGEQSDDHHRNDAAHLLERLLTVRLVEQEARNIGFDETVSLQKQVDAFAEKTLLYELLGRQVEGMPLDEEESDRIYHEISLAAKLRSYRFQKQEHAAAFMKALEAGGDFDTLIAQQVKEEKAVGGEDEDYVLFKDLRSQVAGAANKMEIGEVSKMFQVADGFVVFKLEDRKFVEDPAALEVAQKIAWDQQVAKKTEEFIDAIIEKYATIDEEAQGDFNFAALKEEKPEMKLSEALLKFFDDRRVLATVQTGEQTHTMTVKALADKLKETYFHGTEIDLNAEEADKRANQILEDWIFRIAGKEEARSLGLDQSLRYQLKVEEFERRTLFDTFLQKAIVNDVKYTEEDVRRAYDDNIALYSMPAMVRMKSLPFYTREDALKALNKLQSGSDFKWVSANSEGLVQVEDKDLLDFDAGIISLTSLPNAFQEEAEAVKSGDAIVYSDAEKFHYVIYFEKVYPPEPKPYDQVRSQILKEVFQHRVDDALKAYVEKLKEHYPTEVYLSFQDA